jgi:prophage maintenance system killer protein
MALSVYQTDELMSEYFSNIEIEEIIQYNKDIVKDEDDIFDVDERVLYSIFDKVNNIYEKEMDRKTRIIKKATKILSGITFSQPFGEGNKRTATLVTLMFLNRNGYDIPLICSAEKTRFYKMLINTMFKSRNDPTIYSEIEDYIKQEIVVMKNY